MRIFLRISIRIIIIIKKKSLYFNIYTDCKDIRDLLITYRNCLNRYANYLDALK